MMDMSGSTRGKSRRCVLLAVTKSQIQYGASDLRLLFASPFTALVAGDEWLVRGYMKGRWPRF